MKIKLLNLVVAMCLASLAFGQMSENQIHLSQYRFDDIQITGKTNVNDFHMRYRQQEFSKIPDSLKTGNGMLGIDIPAKQVQADSKMMKNDFLNLIHAQKYPTINIEINHDDIRSSLMTTSSKKEIEIEMNGVTRKFSCQTYAEHCYNDRYCLIGKLKIKLSDFGIDPPHKFLGLVKVQDEIFINFRILFS